MKTNNKEELKVLVITGETDINLVKQGLNLHYFVFNDKRAKRLVRFINEGLNLSKVKEIKEQLNATKSKCIE